jgi:hypothetical protein
MFVRHDSMTGTGQGALQDATFPTTPSWILHVYEASLQLLSKCAGLYNDYFKQSNEQHKYNTRNSTMLMWAIKEQTIANTLVVFNKGVSIWNCLDEESKNINHIFLLRKLQNPITRCLVHVNISGILMTVFCNVLNIP